MPCTPSTVDIYFLADNTGSMGSAISAVKTGASSMLGQIVHDIPGTRFAVGYYKVGPTAKLYFSAGAAVICRFPVPGCLSICPPGLEGKQRETLK